MLVNFKLSNSHSNFVYSFMSVLLVICYLIHIILLLIIIYCWWFILFQSVTILYFSQYYQTHIKCVKFKTTPFYWPESPDKEIQPAGQRGAACCLYETAGATNWAPGVATLAPAGSKWTFRQLNVTGNFALLSWLQQFHLREHTSRFYL